MSTVRKLAQLAGVSIATVSRALRGDPHVLPETRRRVLELAELYRYRPNRLMQSLITGKSSTIGCVLPDVAHPYSARELRGVLAQAFTESYRVLVLENHGKLAHTRQALRTLVELRVEGVLVDGGHAASLPTEAVWELWSQGIALVSLDDSPIDIPVDQVRTDEEQLAMMAVDYLVALGHRAIAYVGPVVQGDRGGRARAMQYAMAASIVPASYVVDIPAEPDARFDAEPTFARLHALVPSPTALIVWEDHVAARLMQQAAHHGLRIPHDLSVLSCGNDPGLVEFVTPTLTSIEQTPDAVGRQAVSLLLERITAGAPTTETPTVTRAIPAHLVERQSCAPPPRTLRRHS